MADRDALSKLAEFKWRATAYPIESSRHSFRHDQAEHKIAYSGRTLVEPLGPQNPTFQYTIPMDQGVARGPYSDLFKQVPILARACYDRKPGQLVDPVYGEWTVVPVDYQSELNARRRGGVIVTVSFQWAPELDQDVQRSGGVDSVSTLVSDAGALDAEVTKLARRYDQEARKPTMDLLDLGSSITGQLSRQAGRIQAQIQRLTYQVEKTERFTNELVRTTRDPDAMGARREARRIRASLNRTNKTLTSLAQDVTQVTVAQVKNVLTVAAEAGMSAKELLSLNPALAAAPLVPAGTVVTIFKPKAA